MIPDGILDKFEVFRDLDLLEVDGFWGKMASAESSDFPSP
jgi:hypothetical protein